jgi:calcium-dependent protein kinase
VKASQQAKQEVEIMKTLDHPNVCRIFETFEEATRFHLVLELIEGQTLFDYVFSHVAKGENLEECVAADLTSQILQGLHYCHARCVIHADIKPENIMLAFVPESTKHCIKIIDFGLACSIKALSPARSGAFRGTFVYAAPEVKNGENHSAASDLWSVGMVAHVLLLGELPSESVQDGEQQLQVLQHPDSKELSPHAQKFLEEILHIEPRRRLIAARIEMTSIKSWAVVAKQHSENCDLPARFSTQCQESFKRFHRCSVLHKAVITAMAMHLLESEETIDIKNSFAAMDYDGNGCLSKSELCAAVSRQAPDSASADITSWIDLVFASIDTDGSGEIEYTEFIAAVFKEGSCRSDQAIHAAFRLFDVDQSGKISPQEFARVVNLMPAAISECMVEFDVDRDGEISFNEFKSIVSNFSVAKPQLLQLPKCFSTPSGRRCFKI